MKSSEWRKVRLGEVITFNPKESIPKGCLAKKISMDKLSPFQRRIEGYEILPYAGGSKFRNGDTLLARITPCLENGKTAQVKILDDNEVGFGSTEFIVLRGKQNQTDNDFVFNLARSEHLREIAIKSMAGTSGRQRAQTDVIENTLIKLPPLQEQKAIAHILSTLDEKIEVNNKINKTLEEMAQSIFKHWFVDFEFPNEDGEPYKSSGGEMVNSELGPIPKGWEVVTLSEITEITMGQSPSGSSYNEDGIGTVFYQGRTDFGRRFPTSRLYTTEPRRMALAGDILLSVRAPVGDINIAVEECCIGRGLCAIRPNKGIESFVFYQLLSLKSIFDIYNGEGTVFGSINKKDLKDIKVILPDEDILIKFDNLVSMFDQEYKELDKESRNLISIRDTLLPKLMSGEIRVPIDNEQ
ncbi:restriction endonuclease subunit S [Gudongella oleilytica]|jgi:type I restriction enzyme S subunit|uniref:restriction endonuclease subunit S n=1 Tax=Gudongella oleilytica TaxID=1582259 RepID=UPI002A370CE8|nr:restriction endonuclease subunit S [Gudongella oleilytica]MDY0256590.1 restriction endonuclease subunit S [Gudongella oleilytica]